MNTIQKPKKNKIKIQAVWGGGGHQPHRRSQFHGKPHQVVEPHSSLVDLLPCEDLPSAEQEALYLHRYIHPFPIISVDK
jgi:hypothetical protein